MVILEFSDLNQHPLQSLVLFTHWVTFSIRALSPVPSVFLTPRSRVEGGCPFLLGKGMLTDHSAELNQDVSPVHHLPQPAVLGVRGLWSQLSGPCGGSCEAPPPLSLLLGILDGLLLLPAGVTVPPTAPGTSL